jgi:hypothetical protein
MRHNSSRQLRSTTRVTAHVEVWFRQLPVALAAFDTTNPSVFNGCVVVKTRALSFSRLPAVRNFEMTSLHRTTIILGICSLLFTNLINITESRSTSSPLVGAPWSGNMHPQNGFPPSCDISRPNSCAPSYADLLSARQLWPCPRGDATPDTCGGGGRCATGEGGLCSNLSSASPCCCPKVGCRCVACCACS